MTIERSFEPTKEVGKDYVELSGSFLTNGSSDPATTYGDGFTVVHAATGVWTVTLDFVFEQYVSAEASLHMATSESAVHSMMIGDKSITSQTFDIIHKTTVKADVAAAAANRIDFRVKVARSDIPGAGIS